MSRTMSILKPSKRTHRTAPTHTPAAHLSEVSHIAARLRRNSSYLYSRAQHIYQTALQEIYPNQTLPGFTDHGVRHIEAVFKLTDDLLLVERQERRRERSCLTDGESFLLIVSVLLHDIGQLYHDFTYKDPIDTFAAHGENGARIIRDYADKFGLNEHEADVIGRICRSHCLHEYRQELPKKFSIDTVGPCRLHSIMAVLRIADLLDLTHSRAPSFIFRLKKFASVSRKHWERHAIISDVVVRTAEWRIAVYARPRSIRQYNEIRRFHCWLEAELQSALADLRALNLAFSHINLEVDSSGFSRPVVPTPTANPFPGLSPFSTSKADVFFGRDIEIEKIVALCRENRFLSLVGESGVGKTSLVNAGVIPELEASGGQVLTYRFSSPIHDSFKSDIYVALGLPAGASRAQLLSAFSELDRKHKNFCLYIDQFEELFTLSFASAEKAKFKRLLVDLLSETTNFRVIISVRSEFLIDLWEVAKMNPIIFSRDNIYRVSKLSLEMATEAIRKPLLRFSNLSWDERLMRRLIEDLRDQGPGIYPPYLQLVCRMLVSEQFKQIKRDPESGREHQWVIDMNLYEDLGGAEKIINDYFLTILDRFTPQEREVVDEILARMITEYSSRKPIHRDEVHAINKGRIDVKRAMQKLIDDRVVKRVYFGFELEHDLLAKKLINLLREAVRASTRIRNVIDYMAQTKHDVVTAAQLSDIAGLSASQLRRKFKVETGKRPFEYLQKLRVEESERLLRDTNDSVKIIAERCGFKTSVRFINAFKQLNDGVTPLAYRKIVREYYGKEFDAGGH